MTILTVYRKEFWIGLKHGPESCSCLGTECYNCRHVWVWDDGTEMTFTDGWVDIPGGKREPDATDRCGRLVDKGWAGSPCSGHLNSQYGYICKRREYCKIYILQK